MVAIPGYSQRITRQAQVADTVNPQAIQQAASGWNAAADVMDVGARVSLKIQEEEKKSRLNEALIDKQRREVDFKSAYEKQRERNPDGYAVDLEKELTAQDESAVKSLPADLREPYRAAAKEYNLRTYKEAVGWENRTRIESIAVSDERSGESLKIMAGRLGEDGRGLEDVLKHADAMYVRGDEIYGAAKNDERDSNLRKQVTASWLDALGNNHPNLAVAELSSGKYDNVLDKATLDALYDKTIKQRQAKASLQFSQRPLADKAAIVGKAANPEDLALDTILQNEGGYVERDGASGQPALFGINRGAHKDEYDAVEKIVKERGQSAGAEYARQFYKREYFDKNEIGKLPPEVQTIVADGMVNHWQGFKTKLLQAARSGASPDQLIEMRRGEYERLAAADKKYAPSLAGWLDRLERLPRGATGTEFDYLPPEKQAEEYKKAQEFAALGSLPNPANAIHQTLVDEMYVGSGLTQRMQQGDEKAINEAVGLTTQYGMIPKSMQTAVGGMIANGSDQQRIVGYGVIDKIGRARPEALSGTGGFGQDVIAEAMVYNSLIEGGMDTTTAMRRIDEARKPQNKDALDMRSQKFNEVAKDINANTVLSALDDTFFSASPDLMGMNADYITSQYKSLLRANYLLYGDMEGAEKATKAAMVNVGVSRVTGKKQMMNYPPEVYYGRGESDYLSKEELTSEIQNQLYDQLVESGVTGKIKKERGGALAGGVVGASFTSEGSREIVTAESKKEALKNVVLIPTLNTAARYAQGYKPAYYIQYKNENGLFDYVRGEDNREIMWQPDNKKIADMREAKAKAEIEKSRKEREALTNLRMNPIVLPMGF